MDADTLSAIKLATAYTKDAISRSELGTKTQLYGIKKHKGAVTGSTAKQIFG
jgi:hypothetical protein